MVWLRWQRKWGVQLALFALVLKLALAFGHHHFDAAHADPGHSHQHEQAVAHLHGTGAHTHQHGVDDAPCPGDHEQVAYAPHGTPGHDHRHDAAQVCFDCLTLAAASLANVTPALAQHQAVTVTRHPVSNNPARLIHHRAAFQSRAPPSVFDAA